MNRQVGIPTRLLRWKKTECSETSAYKIQTPGNYPEESIQHSERGKSLKSTTYIIVSEVEFSEVMDDTEVTVGKPLVLTCRTAQPVEECQWTWKSTSSGNKATEVVMKQFPSSGNDSRDCSVRFDSVVSEQEGMWTCAARLDWQNYFTPAHPMRLSIFTGNLP